jgi:hypothetical protein
MNIDQRSKELTSASSLRLVGNKTNLLEVDLDDTARGDLVLLLELSSFSFSSSESTDDEDSFFLDFGGVFLPPPGRRGDFLVGVSMAL